MSTPAARTASIPPPTGSVSPIPPKRQKHVQSFVQLSSGQQQSTGRQQTVTDHLRAWGEVVGISRVLAVNLEDLLHEKGEPPRSERDKTFVLQWWRRCNTEVYQFSVAPECRRSDGGNAPVRQLLRRAGQDDPAAPFPLPLE